jgi:uncharacterized protein DUF5655
VDLAGPDLRDVYDALLARCAALGPLRVDAVQAGVSVKHTRRFAEIRPRARHVEVWLFLPLPLADARVRRRVPVLAGRVGHQIWLTSLDQIDEALCGWLALAYDAAG